MGDDALTLPVRTVFARACEPEETPLPDTLRPAILGELAGAGLDGADGDVAAVAEAGATGDDDDVDALEPAAHPVRGVHQQHR
ncbi:hypothetical protein, partial [Micromonospora sp. NPDC049799]|uniref:hypothetical protein n=1 Tax=Micromonospora sp. NPDC049799 TaxID=3154741 RepID=UPI0033F0A7CA